MGEGKLRQDALAIVDAALKAVDPAAALKAAVQRNGDKLLIQGQHEVDLAAYRRVIAVGAGKAGAPMAAALEDVLGDRLEQGLVVVKDGHGGPTGAIEIIEASHPVPDERGVAAGQRMATLLEESAAPDTLVFCLLSGGGSALLVAPASGISLADKQETTRLLLASGADIGEINCIRKHLSRQKGGNLARAASPSRVITLIISDVVGDRLDVIASGPTSPDTSTWEGCREIMQRRRIWDQIPAPVRQRMEAGLAGRIPETPKPGDPALAGVLNLVISSNRQAVEVAVGKARELGYQPLVLSTTIEGETSEIARMHAAMGREVIESGNPLAAPCCLISGGETTVTLGPDSGSGGRNQEFALAAALDLENLGRVLLLSVGTDGTDGPTDAAGALADGDTLARGRAQGMEARVFLSRHDAYNYFAPLGDLIITGPTKTNVMDLRLVMVGAE